MNETDDKLQWWSEEKQCAWFIAADTKTYDWSEKNRNINWWSYLDTNKIPLF